MSLFVDASVLVSIVAREPDMAVHADRLQGEPHVLTSAVALWEATLGVARREEIDAEEATRRVNRFVRDAGVQVVPIGRAEWPLAVDAHRRFGKGNHPASLNMGDCFAYACAQANGARLLYKGDDFSRTDLAWSADA